MSRVVQDIAKVMTGGPGNPSARRVGTLRSILIETVSDEDLRDVVKAIIDKARAGDLAAAKLLLLYTIGKPAEAINPDHLDVEEMALFQEEASTAAQMGPVISGIAASTALGVVRAAVPALAVAHIKLFQRSLADPPAPATPPQPQPARAANPDRPPSAPRPATKRPEPRPAPPAQPLPTVEQLRQRIATSPLGVDPLRVFLDDEADEPAPRPLSPSTVTKPEQTARRCANHGP